MSGTFFLDDRLKRVLIKCNFDYDEANAKCPTNVFSAGVPNSRNNASTGDSRGLVVNFATGELAGLISCGSCRGDHSLFHSLYSIKTY